jgi:hypothetical protein
MKFFELRGILRCHDCDGDPAGVDYGRKEFKENIIAASKKAAVKRARKKVQFHASFPQVEGYTATLTEVKRTFVKRFHKR